MQTAFFLHLLVSTCVIYTLSVWFKFFLVIRGTLDLSYMSCVIFAAYIIWWFSVHMWMPMRLTGILALLLCLPVMFLLTVLARRLQGVYFIVGTLGVYMVSLQLALNLDKITWWALWLWGIMRNLVWSIELSSLWVFTACVVGLLLLVTVFIRYFQRSVIYAVIRGQWEHASVVRSLWVQQVMYHLLLISVTTLCSVTGAWIYVYYYQFLDPSSFRFSMLLPVLITAFLSYKANLMQTFLYTLIVVVWYEWLRFIKVVDSASVGYVREMMFGAAMICIWYWFIKRFAVWRTH